MIKKMKYGKSVSALFFLMMCTGMGLSPVDVHASTIGFPDVSKSVANHGRAGGMLVFADAALPPVPANANMLVLPATGKPGHGYGRLGFVPDNPVMVFGRPGHLPPVNPPIDTPAFAHGLVNPPVTMPASVPSRTLPGAGFAQGPVVVPVPAAAWLFGSGLLGLLGMARYRKH